MSTTRKLARIIPDGAKVVDGYPIPAGGSSDAAPPAAGEGGTSDGDGDGGDGSDGGDGTSSPDDDATGSATDGGDGDDSSSDDGGDDGRAGGPEALRADLARERKRRKDAERRERELRQQAESDTERREREAREAAQGPAIRALRSTAVETAASDAGFLYPSDVYALLTADERESIDVDLEDEMPGADREAAAKVVKALAKRRPGLIKAKGDGDGGSGSGGSDHQAGGSSNGSSSSSDPNATLRDLFRKRTTRLSG